MGNKIPSIPDFSTINRRVNRLDIRIENKSKEKSQNNYVIIAIDSTGIKVTNRGQWMTKKWKLNRRKRKGYLKIHVAVDIKSKKIRSMEITDEHVHDNKMLPVLVDALVKSNNGFVVDRILADSGAYDSNDTFRCLSENGIIPGIKVRKNSRVRKTAHFSRNLSVIAQRNDIQKWKDSVSYGHMFNKQCYLRFTYQWPRF